MSGKAVVVSGGMDSVVLAHLIARESGVDRLVSVDYGQRHNRELLFANGCAHDLDVVWHLVDLSGLGQHLSGSALTDIGVDVPEGHYAHPTMAATVVPNRNMILLSIAVGVAVAHGCREVATAVHAGDHPIYPDCRPEFIEEFNETARLATEGYADEKFSVTAPFVEKTKADIVEIGADLGVDFSKTWSCYKEGEIHCGACSTCYERREAFELAGVEDPTDYGATPDYEAPRSRE